LKKERSSGGLSKSTATEASLHFKSKTIEEGETVKKRNRQEKRKREDTVRKESIQGRYIAKGMTDTAQEGILVFEMRTFEKRQKRAESCHGMSPTTRRTVTH